MFEYFEEHKTRKKIFSCSIGLIFLLVMVFNTGMLNAFGRKGLIERVIIRTRLYNTYINEASMEKNFGGVKKYYHIKALKDGNYGLFINIETSPLLVVAGPEKLDQVEMQSEKLTGEDIEIFKELFSKIIIFDSHVALKKRISSREYLVSIFSKFIYRPGNLEIVFRGDKIITAYYNDVRLSKKIKKIINMHSNSKSQKFIENFLLAVPYMSLLRECVKESIKGNNDEFNERLIFVIWLTFLESNYNPHLSGLANEGGIIQVIPELARYLEIKMPDYDRYLLYPGMTVKIWNSIEKKYTECLVQKNGIETTDGIIYINGIVYKNDQDYIFRPDNENQLEIYDTLTIANHSTGEINKYSVKSLVTGAEKILIKIGPNKFIEQHITMGFVHNGYLYTWYLPCPAEDLDERLDPLVMLKVYKYLFEYINSINHYGLSPLKQFTLSIIYFNNGPGFLNKLWTRYEKILLKIEDDDSFIKYIKSKLPPVTVRYVDSFQFLYKMHKEHNTDLSQLGDAGTVVWKNNYYELEHFYQSRNGHELKLIASGKFKELEEYNNKKNIFNIKNKAKVSTNQKGREKGVLQVYCPIWLKNNYEIEELIERIKDKRRSIL